MSNSLSPNISQPSGIADSAVVSTTAASNSQQKAHPNRPKKPSSSFQDSIIAESRATYLKMAFLGVLIVALIILGALPIYWGALYARPKPLDGFIVDFDGSSVGSFVSQALESAPVSAIHWKILSPSNFPGGPSDLARAIKDEQAWVGISINPNATINLNNALASADASYDGKFAITAYAVEARQETAFRNLLRPNLQATLPAFAQTFARQHAQQLSANSAASNIVAAAPQLATVPISYTIDNLVPFDIPIASAITFIGMIYLLILLFILLNITLQARVISGIEHTLSTISLLKVRITTSLIQYFFFSLFYTLLSRAFQLDFTRHFGAGGFPLLWAVNYFGMLALGLALESMLILLTPRFIGFFLLPWVLVNASSAVLPFQVQYTLYRYSRGTPFYNMSQATRTIVFGTKSELGLNIGILLAWTVLSLCTMTAFQLLIRHRAHTAALAAYEEEFFPEMKETDGPNAQRRVTAVEG
ncbi:hypothetical protein DL96DRAFT_1606116 [Flagelloscypha sp. PMI_526]|nr:hypothetical protein DL96DRAFT_1606116 [Flagelloscypha sp. PMI_526]